MSYTWSYPADLNGDFVLLQDILALIFNVDNVKRM